MKYIAILFIGFALLFSACKKGQLGENVCPDASTNLRSPLILSTQNVSLKSNKLNIKAGFSARIQWWLRIRGKSTGAYKEYRGVSDSLNIDWYGNSGTEVFFGAEECSIDLELKCKGIVDHSSFTISQKPDFKTINFGQIYNDYDGTGFYTINGGWVYFDAKTITLTRDINATDDPSPQGGKALTFTGSTINGNNVFFYGGYGKSITGNISSFVALTKQNNTDSIYLNMFVRGYQNTYPNTQLGLAYLKDNDNKNYSLDIDWEGWKMVSVKLSDFISAHGYNGFDGTESLDMSIGAGPNLANKGKYKIDFIILTANEPYLDVQKRNY